MRKWLEQPDIYEPQARVIESVAHSPSTIVGQPHETAVTVPNIAIGRLIVLGLKHSLQLPYYHLRRLSVLVPVKPRQHPQQV